MTTTPVKLMPLVVTDVKNYLFCPRVVYFMYFYPGPRPVTYKMQEGQLSHQRVEELEERRTLRAYGLRDGEREFGVRMHSGRMGLSGLLDMAIVREREAIPVEFKNSTAGLQLNHKYQLTAYALLVEERYRRPVRRGFVYFIPLKRVEEMPITPHMRRYVTRVLREIRQMLTTERMPGGTWRRGRCVECEFRRMCEW